MNNRPKKITLLLIIFLISAFCFSSPITALAAPMSADKIGGDTAWEAYLDVSGQTATGGQQDTMITSGNQAVGGSVKLACWLISWVYSPLDHGVANLLAMKGTNPSSGTGNILSFDRSSGITMTISDVAKDIFDLLLPVGAALVFLFWLLDLLDKISREQFNLELLLKHFIKLLAGFLIIMAGADLIFGIIELANAIIDTINTNTSSNTSLLTSAKTAMANIINDNGSSAAFKALPEAMMYLLPAIGSLVASVVVALVSYGRFIQLGIMIAFAPIGMSDFSTAGITGHGFRFLKRLFAVALQGGFIYVIMAIYAGAVTDFAGSITNFLPLVIFNITVAGTLVKSQQFSSDILGV